ncbi:MAG: hypothetical protein RLZZ450_6149 [Pseudomonadota bacterium]|jgi:hypothetical protein
MSSAGPTGREAVRAFFQYQLDDDDLEPSEPSAEVRVGVALVSGLLGYGAFGLLIGFGTHTPLVGFFVALTIGLGVCIFIQRLQIERELDERRTAKTVNHAEFERLTLATRSFQAELVSRALCRVVDRAQLDPGRLHRFDDRYLLEQERTLFDEARLERKIGVLIDKSLRTLSLGDAFSPEITPVSRRVRGPDDKPGSRYVNPVRLTALLVTDSELICCLVQVDCIGANRHEEVRRISLAKIVDIRFEDTHEVLSADAALLDALAVQLGYSASERSRESMQPDQHGEWTQARATTRLALTSSDGGTLTVPVRNDVELVRHSTTDDHDDELSAEELESDQLGAALHRLLRRQGTFPSHRPMTPRSDPRSAN